MIGFLIRLLSKSKPKPVPAPIPDDIIQMGKLYPVLDLMLDNVSTGEIKMIDNTQEKRIGQALLLSSNREVWVYLGQNYFKNIVKL